MEKRGRYFEYHQGGYRKHALRIAKDLGYSDEITNKIKNAKNDDEIATIMYVSAKSIGE